MLVYTCTIMYIVITYMYVHFWFETITCACSLVSLCVCDVTVCCVTAADEDEAMRPVSKTVHQIRLQPDVTSQRVARVLPPTPDDEQVRPPTPAHCKAFTQQCLYVVITKQCHALSECDCVTLDLLFAHRRKRHCVSVRSWSAPRTSSDSASAASSDSHGTTSAHSGRSTPCWRHSPACTRGEYSAHAPEIDDYIDYRCTFASQTVA